MATLIQPDGTCSDVRPPGAEFHLADLYAALACECVEAIDLADGRVMWLDEEGKFAQPPRPRNAVATALLAEAGGIPGDYIAGPVLITGACETS